MVAVTVACRKAEISVPLCAWCKKAWRPALRARMAAVWSLTLGIISRFRGRPRSQAPVTGV